MGVAAIIWGWDKSPPLFQMISLDPPTFTMRKVRESVYPLAALCRALCQCFTIKWNPFHLLIERMPKSMKLRTMFSLLLCTKADSHIARACSRSVVIVGQLRSVVWSDAGSGGKAHTPNVQEMVNTAKIKADDLLVWYVFSPRQHGHKNIFFKEEESKSSAGSS